MYKDSRVCYLFTVCSITLHPENRCFSFPNYLPFSYTNSLQMCRASLPPILNWVEINLLSFIISQNILFKTSYFSKRTAFKIEKQCMGFSGGAVVEGSACQWRRCRRTEFDPWLGKIPCKRKWQPTPVFLPEKSHGQRSLAGYSQWVHKE